MTTIKGTLYYATWCGHCTKFEPTWNEFKKKIENGDIKSNSKIIIDKYEESELKKQGIEPTIGGSSIAGFPTVKIEVTGKDGKKTEYEYKGKRKLEDLIYHFTKQAPENLKNK